MCGGKEKKDARIKSKKKSNGISKQIKIHLFFEKMDLPLKCATLFPIGIIMLKTNIFHFSSFLAVLTLLSSDAFGLTATKDTVYETGFPIWNKWTHVFELINDSVSLVNNSTDTLIPKKILVLLPIGKKADIGFNLFIGTPQNKKYQKNDSAYPYSTGGTAQVYNFFSLTPLTLKPHEIIFLSNFHVETCIACPTSSFISNLDKLDTLAIKLIVTTNLSSDTLVLIGDIGLSTTSILNENKILRLGINKILNWDNKNLSNANGKINTINSIFPGSIEYYKPKSDKK